MIKTLKNFGVLCAVELVVAVTFLVTVALCLHEEEYAGALVAFGIAGGAVGLGMLRYRKLIAPVSADLVVVDNSDEAKPKRNRAKPAPAKPRKVVKKGKARPKK